MPAAIVGVGPEGYHLLSESLVVVGVGAAFVPARKAARLSPVSALRQE